MHVYIVSYFHRLNYFTINSNSKREDYYDESPIIHNSIENNAFIIVGTEDGFFLKKKERYNTLYIFDDLTDDGWFQIDEKRSGYLFTAGRLAEKCSECAGRVISSAAGLSRTYI